MEHATVRSLEDGVKLVRVLVRYKQPSSFTSDRLHIADLN
jgi:hypothetical protein